MLEELVDDFTTQIARERTRIMKDDAGGKSLGSLTARDIMLGLRGTPTLYWEHSFLGENGLVLRDGRTLADLQGHSVESLILLFLTGQTSRGSHELQQALQKYYREAQDDSAIYMSVIDSLDNNAPAMTQLSSALLALHGSKSRQGRRLHTSLSTKELWKDTLQDALYLLTVLPEIVGYIMVQKYGTQSSSSTSQRGIGGGGGGGEYSFAKEVSHHLISRVTGLSGENVQSFLSLYLILHADHGGGNASAHTSRLVGSTLANPFLSLSSALSSLSGPLHGGANGEALLWMKKLYRHVSTSSSRGSEKDSVRQYTRSALNRGEKIPGFGHAILRQIDPRVVSLLDFAASDRTLCQHPQVVFLRLALPEVGSVLRERGKVRSPYPNIDSVSGVLLGALAEPDSQTAEDMNMDMDAYTADLGLLLFSLGRSIGLLSHLVLDRALGVPLERPDSLPLGQLVTRSKL